MLFMCYQRYSLCTSAAGMPYSLRRYFWSLMTVSLLCFRLLLLVCACCLQLRHVTCQETAAGPGGGEPTGHVTPREGVTPGTRELSTLISLAERGLNHTQYLYDVLEPDIYRTGE